MNRRSFLSSWLGAAALAVAQRVCPAALVPVAGPEFGRIDHAKFEAGLAKMKDRLQPLTFQGIPIRLVNPMDGPLVPTRINFGEQYPRSELMHLMEKAIKQMPKDGALVYYERRH